MCNLTQDEKKFLARKYFMYGFRRIINNENKVLSKKYSPSIREILYDCIEIINETMGAENQKLNNSRDDLIKALGFYIDNSLLSVHEKYSIDLMTLKNKINQNDLKTGDYKKILSTSISMLKKLNVNNIYEHLMQLVKIQTSYRNIDKLVESLLSELLYDGYSLTYLKNWYNQCFASVRFSEETIDELLDQYSLLRKDSFRFLYYFTINNGEIIERQLKINQSINVQRMAKSEVDLFSPLDEKGENIIRHLADEENLFFVHISAMDMYTGLQILVATFNSYFQIHNDMNSKNKVTLNEKVIVCDESQICHKLRIEQSDDVILYTNYEQREILEMEDFMLYRSMAYSVMNTNDEIPNIQRAINIIKSQDKQQKENSLINLWAVLEYMLTFHAGSSIIGKVKDIIPKIVCLYYIKDILNVFWSKLNQVNRDTKGDYEILQQFIVECRRDEESYYYDLDKLIAFIQQEGEMLIDKLKFNDILSREIAKIGQFLTNKESRTKYITNLHEEVIHDLVRIYRTRNILIHSGSRELININQKVLRLFEYNNHLLAVIIHYKKKSQHSTITEILNSIDYTYNNYVLKLNDDTSLSKEICLPSYMFID